MLYQKILVPYDGSEHAKGAVSTAFAMARESNTTQVFVLHVAPFSTTANLLSNDLLAGSVAPSADDGAYADLFDRALSVIGSEMREYVVTALDGLPESRVTIDVVSNPSPVRAITEYAEGHDCDLIIMGRRGLGALRGMIGSVSFGVLRSVEIPVLTVK